MENSEKKSWIDHLDSKLGSLWMLASAFVAMLLLRGPFSTIQFNDDYGMIQQILLGEPLNVGFGRFGYIGLCHLLYTGLAHFGLDVHDFVRVLLWLSFFSFFGVYWQFSRFVSKHSANNFIGPLVLLGSCLLPQSHIMATSILPDNLSLFCFVSGLFLVSEAKSSKRSMLAAVLLIALSVSFREAVLLMFPLAFFVAEDKKQLLKLVAIAAFIALLPTFYFYFQGHPALQFVLPRSLRVFRHALSFSEKLQLSFQTFFSRFWLLFVLNIIGAALLLKSELLTKKLEKLSEISKLSRFFIGLLLSEFLIFLLSNRSGFFEDLRYFVGFFFLFVAVGIYALFNLKMLTGKYRYLLPVVLLLIGFEIYSSREKVFAPYLEAEKWQLSRIQEFRLISNRPLTFFGDVGYEVFGAICAIETLDCEFIRSFSWVPDKKIQSEILFAGERGRVIISTNDFIIDSDTRPEFKAWLKQTCTAQKATAALVEIRCQP